MVTIAVGAAIILKYLLWGFRTVLPAALVVVLSVLCISLWRVSYYSRYCTAMPEVVL